MSEVTLFLEKGLVATTRLLDREGRDLVKLLPVESIHVAIEPQELPQVVVSIHVSVLNVCGVPVLQVRCPDGVTRTGRLILDDGTEFP